MLNILGDCIKFYYSNLFQILSISRDTFREKKNVCAILKVWCWKTFGDISFFIWHSTSYFFFQINAMNEEINEMLTACRFLNMRKWNKHLLHMYGNVFVSVLSFSLRGINHCNGSICHVWANRILFFYTRWLLNDSQNASREIP